MEQPDPSLLLHPDALAASTMFLVRCVSFSAIGFHVWEWFCGLTFEITHIWRKPSTSVVKWQYLVSRYLGIIVQILNAIAISHAHSTFSVSRQFCGLWYYSQMSTGEIMLLSLEISLIHRLFALYDSNYPLAASLGVLVVIENVVYTYFGILAFHEVEHVGACLSTRSPVPIVYMCAAICFTQGVIWFLTFLKCGRRGIPLLSLVIRDGSWVCAIITAFLSLATANVILSSKPAQPASPGLIHLIFPFYAALISISNCRLIVNLEALPPRQDHNTSTGIEFTSFITSAGEPEAA